MQLKQAFKTDPFVLYHKNNAQLKQEAFTDQLTDILNQLSSDILDYPAYNQFVLKYIEKNALIYSQHLQRIVIADVDDYAKKIGQQIYTNYLDHISDKVDLVTSNPGSSWWSSSPRE